MFDIKYLFIFVLLIVSCNAKSENTNLKYSPIRGCILPAVNSVAIDDKPSPVGLVFIMKYKPRELRRITTEHGYIIVYVGKNHHLADSRGYAYEHRVLAEIKISRKLKDNEEVHHIDGNRSNNSFDNLEVLKSRAHHLFLHRKSDRGKKLPDQNNPIIKCACGCGSDILRFDDTNRPRAYIWGHNPPERETMNLILKEINNGVITSKSLYKSINKSKNAIKVALSKMAKLNMIVRIKPGYYGPLGTPTRQNPIIECCCGCKNKFYQFDKTWRERKYISGHNMRQIKYGKRF